MLWRLAWDLTGRRTVIVWENSDGVHRRELEAKKASVALLPAIGEIVALHQEPPAALAVVRGPGSFTGIRTALATAMGLQAAWRAPAFGFTAFEIIAATAPFSPPYRIVLAGVRGFVYEAACDNAGLWTTPRQVKPEQIGSELTIVGPAPIAGLDVTVHLCDLAAGCLALAKSLTLVDDSARFPLEAFYLRPPDTIVGVPLIKKLLRSESAS